MKCDKKVIVCIWGIMILFISVLSLGELSSFAGDNKPILLRYSEISPPKGTRPASVKWWKSEVEEKTKGRVKIEMYWSASLLKGKENVQGVGSGVADLGYVAPQYNPSDLPTWTFVSGFPFATTSLKKVYEAKYQLYDQENALREELKSKNLQLIGIFPYDFYTLWTKPRRINTLEDLKGLKLRVSSDGHAKVLKAAGCASVFMPAGDIYTAVQKGTVNGMTFPLEHTYAYGLHEVVSYGADIHLLGITALLAMNLSAYQKLPREIQKIMSEAGRQMTFHLLRGIEKNRAETIKKVEQSGVEMYALPKLELKKWANLPAVKNLRDDWITDKEKKGLPGKRVMKKFTDLMK